MQGALPHNTNPFEAVTRGYDLNNSLNPNRHGWLSFRLITLFLTQKSICKESKWMRGTHNFTIDTIA